MERLLNSHKRFPLVRTGGFLPAGLAELSHKNIHNSFVGVSSEQ